MRGEVIVWLTWPEPEGCAENEGRHSEMTWLCRLVPHMWYTDLDHHASFPAQTCAAHQLAKAQNTIECPEFITKLPLSSKMSDHQAINPETDFSKFQLLHEVFRHRAADPIQTKLMAFPRVGFADFEYFTGKTLDQFTDAAAWHYAKANLQIVRQIGQALTLMTTTYAINYT